MTTTPKRPYIARPLLLIAGILLIAANLRAPVTGVAPILGMIRGDTGISATEAGMLMTLPLLAFAAVSPFAAIMGREYGTERSLFAALILIAAGTVLRFLDPIWCLFLGTGVIGVGIAIANVLLPSLIKRDFPHRIGDLTAMYALTGGLIAALASAVAVPLASMPSIGWRATLAVFLIIPIVAALIWLPQLGNRTAPAKGTASAPHGGRVWHSALAWQVTLFMGLTSLVYYVVAGWLPTILMAGGYSADFAGSIHGISQLAAAVPGFFLGPVIRRLKDQRSIAAGFSLLTGVSLFGLWLIPSWGLVWSVLFGFSIGAVFILALAFVSLRAGSAQRAAALSGMAQCVGYTLAAAGPPLAGYLHDQTGGWGLPLMCCVAATMLLANFGYFAGRSHTV